MIGSVRNIAARSRRVERFLEDRICVSEDSQVARSISAGRRSLGDSIDAASVSRERDGIPRSAVGEEDRTGCSIRYITNPQQTETKEARGSELRLRLIILRAIFPLQRPFKGQRGWESERSARGSDLTPDNTTTTRCEGRAHVTRRLAGATKYCGRAIRDVRGTPDVIRGTRVSERDDVVGAAFSIEPARAGDDERSHVRRESEIVPARLGDT